MINNIILPLIMRESGLVVNETAKIYSEVPTNEHQYIYDGTIEVRIPISFTGTFSYFKTRSLKNYEIKTVMSIM